MLNFDFRTFKVPVIASTIAILRVFWFHRLDRKKELLLKIQSKNGLLSVPCSVAEIARYERYITANESSSVEYIFVWSSRSLKNLQMSWSRVTRTNLKRFSMTKLTYSNISLNANKKIVNKTLMELLRDSYFRLNNNKEK